jgi:Tol biopolymer transport system component
LILPLLLALTPGISPAIGTSPPLEIPTGHRQQLNESLISGGNVLGSRVSPDSSTTVYIADQDTDDVYELYRVTLEDGAVTKISDVLIPSGDVFYFEISPDSSTVVYVADQNTDNVYELYSVPIHGGIATRIHPPLHFFGNGVGDFCISPDSNTVLFIADLDSSAERHGLYQTPINGGGFTTVAGPFEEGREINDFVFSPDGRNVVYRADVGIVERPSLYSVPIDGGAPLQISGSDIPIGDGVKRFNISSDGSTVVYIKETFSTDLYSVPIGGGTSTMINERLFSGMSPFPTSDVDSFLISADSSTVVFRSDETTDNADEIYAVPIEGGAPLRLNGTLVANGDVHNFSISGDSSMVVYRADQDHEDVVELYSVSIAGGANIRINGNLDDGGT